jgi:hypothetical protein
VGGKYCNGSYRQRMGWYVLNWSRSG